MVASVSSSSIALLAPATTAKSAALTPAPETAEEQAADASLQAMKDTVVKLKADASSNSGSATSASMAKAKLQALQQRLKMLMLMGGDPKQVAKEAAQIAKQIGQAAKDYADAAGGSDSGASAEAASDTASAQAATSSAAGAGSQAAAPSDAASQSANQTANNAPAAATAGDSKTDTSNADGSGDPDSADPSKDGGTNATPTPVQPQAQKAAAPQAMTTTMAINKANAGKTKIPDPVIEEARVLEASAQAIAKAALAKLKAEHKTNPDAKAEADNLEQGQKDFTAASKEIYGDTGEPSQSSSSSGYSDQGQPVAAAPAAQPAVSVQA